MTLTRERHSAMAMPMPKTMPKAHSSPNSHGAWNSMRMLRWSTMQQLVLGGMMGGTWSEVGSTNLVGTCPARWPLHYTAETMGAAKKRRRDFIARRELFLALAIYLSFSFSFFVLFSLVFGKCPWDPDPLVWIFGRGRQKVHQVGVNRQRLKDSGLLFMIQVTSSGLWNNVKLSSPRS